MKGDDYTWLERGVHRPRRVSSGQNSLSQFVNFAFQRPDIELGTVQHGVIHTGSR